MNKDSPFEISFVLSASDSLSSLSSGCSYSTFSSTNNLFAPDNHDRSLAKGVEKGLRRVKRKKHKRGKSKDFKHYTKRKMYPNLNDPKLPPEITEPSKLAEMLNSEYVNAPLKEITLEVLEKPVPELCEVVVESPVEVPTKEQEQNLVVDSGLTQKYFNRWQLLTRTKHRRTLSRCWKFYTNYIGGSMPLSGKLIEKIDFAPLFLLTAMDSICRGIGQVVFMNNTITGLFILASLIYASPFIGLAGLLGVTVSTMTAIVLGVNKSAIRAGLYGYNGVLTGLAIATFYSNLSFGLIAGPIVFCSILSVFLSLALSNLLGPQWDIPCFTLPFNIVTAVFIVASIGVANFPRAALPALATPVATAAGYASISWITVPQTILIGVSQVFLAANWITGLLMLIGILICSPIACFMAIIGSSFGMMTAFALGASESEITFGLWGYNSVLGAIAISVFFVFNLKVFLFAVFCAITCGLFFALCKVLFTFVALPALTFPFCLATLIFVLAKQSIPGIQPVPLSEADYPEKNIRNFELKTKVLSALIWTKQRFASGVHRKQVGSQEVGSSNATADHNKKPASVV